MIFGRERIAHASETEELSAGPWERARPPRGNARGERVEAVGFCRFCCCGGSAVRMVGVADEVDLGQGGAELGVCVFVEGIEVGAHGAGEEDWILRDDG